MTRTIKEYSPEHRADVKAGYAAYTDYILRDVVKRNRMKWAQYPHTHPIKTEQLWVADIAAEILKERGV